MADLIQVARQAAMKYGINPDLFVKQINAESSFNPNARSPAGAIGIAQFIPSTAKQYGVNVNDPVSSLNGAARMMADSLKRTGGDWRAALSIYNSGRPDGYKSIPETAKYVAKILNGSNPAQPSWTVKSPVPGPAEKTIPGVDRSGQRSALLLNYLENDHAPDALLNLGTGLAQAKDTPARTIALRAQGAPSAPSTGGGVASFNGTQVAAWMVPALRYAQQHGWDGKLTSGVRTRAEQAALYANRANNPNPVAPPGKSNHEVENGGAVDVANPAALARALRGFKGRTLVQGTAIGDPVHFSATGR